MICGTGHGCSLLIWMQCAVMVKGVLETGGGCGVRELPGFRTTRANIAGRVRRRGR
jgi:hypothetical protein